ncbi:periphilin-1 isoform X2 [Gouania willdenowi]|uniref:periphilin-1 isoform X2 n=1 Tax=Gouania willdenowi TaxID=441366 RepID=UPI001055A3C1|nr:periphilin-1 isoform X2 [Gouania willdenowi]
MAYRRDWNLREVYEERFLQERSGQYPRGGGERRGPFGRPEDDYGRGGGYDYEGGSRFYPNGGGPRGYHEDQRGHHGDGARFPAERRGVPSRREDFPYRGQREEPHPGRSVEFGSRAPPTHNMRSQGVYPTPRPLPDSGEDSLVQAILNIDKSASSDELFRRKAGLLPPHRDRSPTRRDGPRSPHSRSGSSVSSRGYSPDRVKAAAFSSLQDKIPGLSRESSPHSAASNKEDKVPPEAEKEDQLVASVVEESQKSTETFQERRSLAIASKAQEIEKVYRQDCETFGMVVKMLVAKDPNLEKQLQVPLRESLGEIRERCLEDLKHFISELDDVVRQAEPSTCDSTTPSTSLTSHKVSKTTVNPTTAY